MYPSDRKYHKEHEWVKVEGNVATIGLSNYAQEALGDIVFVELPEEGTEVKAGDSLGEVESVKSVSPIYAPVSGKVVKANGEVAARPELINEDCYGGGWIAQLDLSEPSQIELLMGADAYEKYVQEM